MWLAPFAAGLTSRLQLTLPSQSTVLPSLMTCDTWPLYRGEPSRHNRRRRRSDGRSLRGRHRQVLVDTGAPQPCATRDAFRNTVLGPPQGSSVRAARGARDYTRFNGHGELSRHGSRVRGVVVFQFTWRGPKTEPHGGETYCHHPAASSADEVGVVRPPPRFGVA